MAAFIVFIQRRRRLLRRERIFRDRNHPLEKYYDTELYSKFRFRRQDILGLTDSLHDKLERPNRRGGIRAFIMCQFAAALFSVFLGFTAATTTPAPSYSSNSLGLASIMEFLGNAGPNNASSSNSASTGPTSFLDILGNPGSSSTSTNPNTSSTSMGLDLFNLLNSPASGSVSNPNGNTGTGTGVGSLFSPLTCLFTGDPPNCFLMRRLMSEAVGSGSGGGGGSIITPLLISRMMDFSDVFNRMLLFSSLQPMGDNPSSNMINPLLFLDLTNN